MRKGLPLLITLLLSQPLICANSWAADLLRPTTGTTPTTLTPIPLKPAPTSTITQSNDSLTSYLSTDDISAVVATVFKDARFTANSCGGDSSSWKTVLSMPNLWFREEGMERLEYNLTSNEKDQTKFLNGDAYNRVRAVRSCFKYWRSLTWGGMVANGKFVLVLQLVTDPELTAVIEDREISEYHPKYNPIPRWVDQWNWGDNRADYFLQDYRLSRIRLEIRLTPAVANGAISYNAAEAVWIIDGQGFDNSLPTWHDDLLNTLRIKIVDYKDRWLEVIRTRLITPIGAPEVQGKLSAAITEKFRAKHRATGPINSITGVIGNGSTITVQHN